MQQVSELSKPLKMYKHFEEINSNNGKKRPMDEQQKGSERKNSSYGYSERPLKQMKFFDEEQSNTSTSSLSTSTSVLQPHMEQFRDVFSVPLYNEQSTQFLLKLGQVFKAHAEHSETSFKQMNINVNEEQSDSTFLASSADVLQPSVEQFKNTQFVPSCNEEDVKNFSKAEQIFKTSDERPFKQMSFYVIEGQSSSEPVFKTLDERPFIEMNLCTNERQSNLEPVFKTSDEKSFQQMNFCNNEGQSNLTDVSSSIDIMQTSIKHFRNTYFAPVHSEQSVKSLSKSEPVFKTLDEIPFDQISFRAREKPPSSEPVFKTLDERPFKQINFCASEEQHSSIISPTSINVLQTLVEQTKNTNSIPLCNEQDVKILSKSKQVCKAHIEHSEKTFKQIKFCSNEKQSNSSCMSTSTNILQSAVKQLKNRNSVSLHSEQNSEIVSSSKQDFKTPSSNVKEKPQPPYQIKDIFIERDKEIRIISALGLSFIKDFAEIAKKNINRFQTPINVIDFISYKLRFRKCYRFVLERDPDSPIFASTFYSKFILKDCLIACETSMYKKKAKILCAEAAINTLVKLATVEKCKSVINYRPTRKRINNNELLEIFRRNIINRIKNEPAIVTFKSIASLIDMESCIVFNVVSKTISDILTEYTCKFFINGILISYATDDTSQSSKNVAAELGLMKLSNLSEYEIHKGELKKRINHNNKTVDSIIPYSSKASSDVGVNNLEEPSFILNKILFDSSIKDGIVLVERDNCKININKGLRNLIAEVATFCHKKFVVETEEISESIPPYRKVKVNIGGIEVGVGIAFSTDEAKTIACTKAYINMKKKYYTLRIKDQFIEGYLVNRDQVFIGEPYNKNVINSKYLEFKKVKKYGSNHVTVAEKKRNSSVEIKAETSSSSQTDSESPKKYHNLLLFRDNLEVLLKEFKESEEYCELLFSEEFSKVERFEIVKLVKKLHLRHHLREADNRKVVCVSHRHQMEKLLNYLVINDGCNYKFELIDASTAVI